MSAWSARVVEALADDIHVPDGWREVDGAKVRALAESIRAIGLQNPIAAHVNNDPSIEESLVLDAGRHRLDAMRLLGWERVPCINLDDLDALDRELWQIDENLCRAELGEAEVASLTARRAKIVEERQARDANAAETGGKSLPTSLKDGRKAGPQHRKRFAAETAAATGKSKRSINQARRRGERIAPDVLEQIPGTALDKGVELDALAAMPPDEQREAVAKVKRGEAASVRPMQSEAQRSIYLMRGVLNDCMRLRQSERLAVFEGVFETLDDQHKQRARLWMIHHGQ